VSVSYNCGASGSAPRTTRCAAPMPIPARNARKARPLLPGSRWMFPRSRSIPPTATGPASTRSWSSSTVRP